MYLPRSSGQISQHKEEYGNSQKRIAVIVLFFTMILSGVSFLAPSNIIAQEVHGRQASSQQERISFRVVSWNIENLFDTHHDSLKNDHEYLPDAIRHWNYSRYKKKLADDAIYLERVLCDEAGGWQDQIAASFGGFNRINFNADGYEVLPVIISPERKRQLNENLMMFFTGFTRFSSEVQKANGETKKDKISQLRQMYELVDEAERIVTDQNTSLDEFGRLLDVTWKLKRQTGKAVSTDHIDILYSKGIEAGALGGKLLGAGGGGFLVFYVQPEKQEAVKKAMSDLMYIPFSFEDGGTRVIHYTPEIYVPQE